MTGWLTCADCSSLGMDGAVAPAGSPPPTSGTCSACGGPWPARATALPDSEPLYVDIPALAARVRARVRSVTAEPAYVGHCYATPDGRVVHEAEPRVTSTATAPLSSESRTR